MASKRGSRGSAGGSKKGASSAERSSSSPSKRSSSQSASRRGSGRREEIKNRAGSFYVKRTGSGQFREADEKGRSLAADRRQKARTKVRSGYGDRGDRT